VSSNNPSGAENQQETVESPLELDPYWIAGFVDGEGCFSVSVHRNRYMHRHGGWQLQAAFQVYQHQDHLDVLEALKSYFGCGSITSKGPGSSVMTYSVYRLEDLSSRIVPFFENTKLRVKDEDFRSFASIVRAMEKHEHLSESGFESIVRLAYAMNANGKQRSRALDEILDGILRDCTPSSE
jgi:LAGLIDADG endonuclease